MDTQALIEKKREFAATYFRSPANAAHPDKQRQPRVSTARTPNPHDVELGRRVREVRTARRCTQERLAAELQITFQQVQKYENGTNRISATRLVEIANCLGVTISDLLENAPASNCKPDAEYLSPSEKSLLCAWRVMSPRNRKSVAIIVASLAADPATPRRG